METEAGDEHGSLSPEQVLERADKMVRAGRMSQEDADRLRAAATQGDLPEAVATVRRGHAGARVLQAIDSGALSPEDGARLLERIEGGEDPRHVVRGVRTGGGHRPGDGPDPGGAPT